MKKAFTMVELVFIIVIAGIIAMVALPRFKTSRLFEGRDEIISKIRYTQHLALLDNKFEIDNANWYQKNWYIEFDNSDPKNLLMSIKSEGNYAIDPSNSKFIIKNINLSKEYGIKLLDTGYDKCAHNTISFDNLGRASLDNPSTYTNPYSNLVAKGKYGCCEIRFADLSNKNPKDENTAIIEIYGESGYVRYKEKGDKECGQRTADPNIHS